MAGSTTTVIPAITADRHSPIHSESLSPLPRGMSSDDRVSFTMPDIRQGREFVCGWGAASVNIVTTFPINKLIFRQQLGGVDSMSALRQLQKEGFTQLYRGVLPPLLQKSTSLALMFGMYDKFNCMLTDNFSPHVPAAATKITSAVMAGCCEALLTPFERIQTLLQDKFYRLQYRNTAHAFQDLSKHGVREFYRGLTPILMRNGPSNALFFLFRGDIKTLLPKWDALDQGRSGEIAKNFISGGLLGALISTIVYPVNVVKTRMQCRVGGQFSTFRATLRIVYEERNKSIRAVFRGVHINYTRSMISWGIINASYEFLESLFKDWESNRNNGT